MTSCGVRAILLRVESYFYLRLHTASAHKLWGGNPVGGICQPRAVDDRTPNVFVPFGLTDRAAERGNAVLSFAASGTSLPLIRRCLVRVAGFEPATTRSQSECSTRLSYTHKVQLLRRATVACTVQT